jgi:HEXXH motif-containing protein
MLKRHSLPASDFDTLAEGLGSVDAIAALRSAQLSRRLIGLRAVVDTVERARRSDARGFLVALDLLESAQNCDSAAVAAVLGYPLIGSWMAHCLKALGASADGTAADLDYLACIAAAAAAQAGVPFHIEVPVRGGAVYLPTLGRMISGDTPTAIVEGDGREVVISGLPLSITERRWQPLRRLTSTTDGLTFTVTLDDMDLFRSFGALPLTSRLDTADVRAWEQTLQKAWKILVQHHIDHANAIRTGICSIVPLVAVRPNRGINATSRESFGSIAMSMASDPLTFAGALVHEFQHTKLNGVLDLVDLYRPSHVRYYAPWREDPRPFGGLLHGAYAFLGVCDFWRVQRMLPMTRFPIYAAMEYARWSDRTSRVVDGLLSSGNLTEAGERFVLRMRERLASWTERMPDEPSYLAKTASADHRVSWRLRNLWPDADTTECLVNAWLAGKSVPPNGAVPAKVVGGGSTLGATTRLDLIQLRLREPNLFAQTMGLTLRGIAATPPDLDFVYGDVVAAAAGYRARIVSHPETRDAWAGLALALRSTSDDLAAAALLNGPELVYAVYNRLVKISQRVPGPEVIAAWLAPIIRSDPWH